MAGRTPGSRMGVRIKIRPDLIVGYGPSGPSGGKCGPPSTFPVCDYTAMRMVNTAASVRIYPAVLGECQQRACYAARWMALHPDLRGANLNLAMRKDSDRGINA